METAKWPFYWLVMVFALIIAVQPVAQAGQNLELWPVDGSAKGDRSTGQLTVYYEVMPADECVTEIENPIPGEPPLIVIEPKVKLIFFLRLYEKRAKKWHIITAEDSGDPADSYYCLTGDAITGLQQEALLRFLEDEVLPVLSDPSYTAIFLKDVVDDYENATAIPKAPPYCISAEITIVAQ